uniref:Conjugative transfer protein n=1 Tax=Escherichia coli TaxID=562 RepID=A0A7U1HR63_ECOLX|nr:Conjugative transfer protein [Escherichia coli]
MHKSEAEKIDSILDEHNDIYHSVMFLSCSTVRYSEG